MSGDRTMFGIAAVVASTFCYPLSDLAAKSLVSVLPPIEVAWLRYMVFFMAALPLMLRGRRAFASVRPGMQILRASMSAASTVSAIVAFHFLPVAETTAIGFVYPVIVTALAMLFLGERVGPRRWSAAVVALIGVLVIVRPGSGSFCMAALIPLGGAFASAIAVIGTRLNKGDSATTTVLYTVMVGTALLSVLVLFFWQTPTLAQLGTASIAGLFGMLGSILGMLAYRLAPASLVAPFSYLQLIWAGGLSFLVLGTVPTVCMVVGSLIIAGSASYTAYRERVRAVG